MSDAREKALAALDERFDAWIGCLQELVRIPSVSAPGHDSVPLARSAVAVARLLANAGFDHVEAVRAGGANPSVLARRRGPSGAPRVLFYAHHDVQPPGEAERWSSPPFEPQRRAGRLYGRGAVDDKAAIVALAAAVRAWLDARGELPLGIVALVDGEEEIGSPHLPALLESRRKELAAQVLVLCDTANLARGLPSLTVSLRGLVSVDVSVRTLERPLHSGVWGGPVPEAASALAALLARLRDRAGSIAVPGLEDDVPPLGEREREWLASLPFDPGVFRAEAGLLDGVRPLASEAPQVYAQLWLQPALAVTALEAVTLAEAANQLLPRAQARVSVRIAPGQDPQRVASCLMAYLLRDPPWGARIETRLQVAVGGWRIDPTGPAFEAAERALALGYGRPPVRIGCGATIPFVAPLCKALGGAPALLLGLEDPACNAHGEDESVDLSDLRSAARALVHLFQELADRGATLAAC